MIFMMWVCERGDADEFGIRCEGGKNRRRGKNENDDDKRELVFREDGQGKSFLNVMLEMALIREILIEKSTLKLSRC